MNDLVLQQMAAAEAVLSSDEKELGVALVDIGGGTTDIAVFSDGSIQHTSVIRVGGDQLTNDIAVGLRTPMVEAEKIKKRYGCALGSLVNKDETMAVPGVGGRQPRVLSTACWPISPNRGWRRSLGLARRELEKHNLSQMVASGMVLTGGTVAVEGICELAEQLFDMPVRLGLSHRNQRSRRCSQLPCLCDRCGSGALGSAQQGWILWRLITTAGPSTA